MTILFSNNASTTVSGSISSVDTTVTLLSGTIFPHPLNVGDYFVATFYDQQTKTLNEIVHVTNLTGNTATIVRGQEGTTPLAWNSGDIFANLVTAGTLNAFLQQGAVPVDTTDVYVGDDVSTVPNHIVCNTVPVPPDYALGMVFVIRVKNVNTGPVDCSFNGKPAIFAKRTDGSDMAAGNIVGAQEFLFIYNGTFFSTTIMPVPIPPPVGTFYIRADSTSIINSSGIESNSGFYNTPQDAFKSIQGAVLTIKSRYISTTALTLRVADGTYRGGLFEADNYISNWTITGNTANPSACVIDATSTNVAGNDNPKAPLGTGIWCGTSSNIVVSGFNIKSYNYGVYSDGWLEVHDSLLNGPIHGDGTAFASASGGSVLCYGTITYQQSGGATCIFDAGPSGLITLGKLGTDTQPAVAFHLQVMGSYTMDSICLAYSNGTINVYNPVVSCGGPVMNCRPYDAFMGGGVDFYGGDTTIFNSICNQPGLSTPPGWAY